MFEGDYYNDLDKALWALARWSADAHVPLARPLDVHLAMIATMPFDELPSHVKNVARYIELSKKEVDMLTNATYDEMTPKARIMARRLGIKPKERDET